MTIFDQTETQFEHDAGNLVKYDNEVIVIGGYSTASVEKLNAKQTKWKKHPMGPVNDLKKLRYFTAVSLKKSLFIFGLLRSVKWKIKIISGGYSNRRGVLEWDGTSWRSLLNELCTRRMYHTTIVYGAEVYHMGRFEGRVGR